MKHFKIAIKLFSLLFIFGMMCCSSSKKQNRLNQNIVSQEIDKPNIIFILADDLGYGDLSVYNEHSKIQTKYLDQLANEGVQFTDAHTSSAVCTPTRYGILTGRYNWRSTLKKSVLRGFSKALIPTDRKTLPSYLQDNGYKTAGIGKWHLGWDWANIEAGTDSVDYSRPIANGPRTIGFDYWYGFSGSLDMAPYVWVENDHPTMVPTKYTVNEDYQGFWRNGLTSDDFDHEQVLPHIKDKTVNFIHENANGEKPFFVYMPLPAPHTPILPTPQFKGVSGLDNPYADFVIMVDWIVGEVMAALESQDIADNTILIFTSDNGCSPRGDFEQLETKGHDPSYLYRGHKADIFEGGHRVPYIVRWPEKLRPKKSDKLVCTTDLFATISDIINVPLEDDFGEDSFSFLESLGLPSDSPKRESIVHHSIDGSFAYRKNDYKAIFCPGSGGWSFPRPNRDSMTGLPPFQLYNLKTDAAEEINLSDSKVKILEAYRQELISIINNGRSTTGLPQKNDEVDEWPQLEKLLNGN